MKLFYWMLSSIFSLPYFAKAEEAISIELPNPTGVSNVQDLINKLIDWLLIAVGPVATIMVIWAGFLILTAGDNAGKYKQGINIIKYVAIGIAFILCAKGVALVVKQFFGVE